MYCELLVFSPQRTDICPVLRFYRTERGFQRTQLIKGSFESVQKRVAFWIGPSAIAIQFFQLRSLTEKAISDLEEHSSLSVNFEPQ